MTSTGTAQRPAYPSNRPAATNEQIFAALPPVPGEEVLSQRIPEQLPQFLFTVDKLPDNQNLNNTDVDKNIALTVGTLAELSTVLTDVTTVLTREELRIDNVTKDVQKRGIRSLVWTLPLPVRTLQFMAANFLLRFAWQYVSQDRGAPPNETGQTLARQLRYFQLQNVAYTNAVNSRTLDWLSELIGKATKQPALALQLDAGLKSFARLFNKTTEQGALASRVQELEAENTAYATTALVVSAERAKHRLELQAFREQAGGAYQNGVNEEHVRMLAQYNRRLIFGSATELNDILMKSLLRSAEKSQDKPVISSQLFPSDVFVQLMTQLRREIDLGTKDMAGIRTQQLIFPSDVFTQLMGELRRGGAASAAVARVHGIRALFPGDAFVELMQELRRGGGGGGGGGAALSRSRGMSSLFPSDLFVETMKQFKNPPYVGPGFGWGDGNQPLADNGLAQEENAALQLELTRLEQEKAELEQKIMDLEDEKALTMSNKPATNTTDAMQLDQEQLAQAEVTIAELRDNLDTRTSALDAKIVSLETSLTAKDRELASKQKEIDRIAAKHSDELGDINSKLREALAAAQRNKDALEAATRQAAQNTTAEDARHKAETDKLASQIKALQQQVDSFKSTGTNAQRDLAAAQEQISSLTATALVSARELATARQGLASAQREFEQANAEVVRIQARLKAANTELETTRTNASKTETELARVSGTLLQVQGALASKDAELREARARAETFSTGAASTSEAITRLSREKDALDQSILSAQAEHRIAIAAVASERDVLKQAIERIREAEKTRVAALEANITALQEQNAEYQRTVRAQEQRIGVLQNEKLELERQIAVCGATSSELTDRLRQLEIEITRLNGIIQARDTELSAIQTAATRASTSGAPSALILENARLSAMVISLTDARTRAEKLQRDLDAVLTQRAFIDGSLPNVSGPSAKRQSIFGKGSDMPPSFITNEQSAARARESLAAVPKTGSPSAADAALTTGYEDDDDYSDASLMSA